jgi:hypothetical protein
MHGNHPADDNLGDILSRQEAAGGNLGLSGEPFEGPLKPKEKGTSAKGRLSGEDDASAMAYGKEGDEHTQEWWEGYDPGMDVGF